MHRKGNISAKTVEGLVAAQCKDVHTSRSDKTKTDKGGKSWVSTVLDAAAHLGR